MGSEISYIRCCSIRNKEEPKSEKIEEIQPSQINQPEVIERKDDKPPQASEELFLKRKVIVQGNPLIENCEMSSLNDQNLLKLSEVDSDFPHDPNLYTEFKPDHLSSIGDYFIKIYVDYLEVTYKLCDDFEINYENQRKTLYMLDERMNNSNFSDINDINISDNSNNVINLSAIERNHAVNNIISKDKSFTFKIEETFTGNNYTSYFPIIFTVKNTKIYSFLHSGNPSITIGEAHIPPNIVFSKKKGVFEGNLRVMLRKVQEIGRMKVKIIIDQIESSALENKNEIDNSFKLHNLIDTNMIYNQEDIWDDDITNYYEIEPVLLNRYFLFEDLTHQKRNLKLANKLIINNVFDANMLANIYMKTIKQDNSVSLYQILNQLIKLAMYDDFNPVHDFFNLISQEKNNLFFEISQATLCNVYIVERFLMFLYFSQRYYNSSRSPNVRNKKFWDDYYIAELIYKTIKRLFDQYTKHSYDGLYLIKVRDCLIWCLNNLNELLTLPNYLNSLSEDQRTKEYTSIYKCCISVMSYKVSLLKLIDVYSSDSQMMSGLFKVFRKATQLLTYDSSTLLDKEQLDESPYSISKKYKISLIEKNKGFFISLLKFMLQKYHHYPELHLNILILVFQITGFIDSKYIISAYKLLGPKEFSEYFLIYRAKLKKFSKILNNLHLNCLSNLSEITKSEAKYMESDSEEYQTHLNEVMNDFRSFYKVKKPSKRKNDFISSKQEEFEIQEIVIRIFANLVRSNFLFKDLIKDTYIFIDIIDYLGKFTGQYKAKDNKEYIRYLLEKERKSGEGIRKSILSLVENSVSVIKSFVIRGRENAEDFKNLKSSLSNSYTKNYMISLITSCLKNLKSYQIFSTILDGLVTETKEIIEGSWN